MPDTRWRRITLTVTSVTVAAVFGIHAQQPGQSAPPTGAISGVVVDGTSGQPVQGAVVTLLGPNDAFATSSGVVSQITDAKGRFVFADVPVAAQRATVGDNGCACYSLDASRGGFLDGVFGSDDSRPGGALGITMYRLRNITFSAGEWLRDLRITLWRPGSISGTLRDERGEPIVAATVRVLSRFVIGGTTRLAAGPVAQTDDRGMYRIGGLTPGEYAVVVPSSLLPIEGASGDAAAARHDAYPTTYFPGTPNMDSAQLVTLGRGQAREGVDLQLGPVGTFRISGRVLGDTDGVLVRLMPSGAETLGLGSETAAAEMADDGRFTFSNVPAGTYTLRASSLISEWVRAPDAGVRPLALSDSVWAGMRPTFHLFGSSSPLGDDGPTLWFGNAGAPVSGTVRVVLDSRDLDNVELALKSGVKLSGTIHLEGERNLWTAGIEVGGRLMTPRVPMSLQPSLGDLSLGLPSATGAPDLDRCPTAGSLGTAGGVPTTFPAASCGNFTFEGLLPGEYYLDAGAGRAIKSAIWNGRDYADAPIDTTDGTDISGIDITVTTQLAVINGTVRSSQGGSAFGEAVLYFPTNPDTWSHVGFRSRHFGSVMVSTNGSYDISLLPAGDYFLAVVPDAQRNVWQRPDILATLTATAARVQVAWGETRRQDIVTR